MSPATKGAARSKAAKPQAHSMLEFVLLGIAIAAIAAVVVALVASGLRNSEIPPQLQVSVGAASAESGRVIYQVSARNSGGEPAENVEIEVSVGAETRTLTLAEVEERDQATGVVVFPPGTTGPAEARVQSYGTAGR